MINYWKEAQMSRSPLDTRYRYAPVRSVSDHNLKRELERLTQRAIQTCAPEDLKHVEILRARMIQEGLVTDSGED
jgi:hypothetical protein